jgi:uncharacterized protein YdiU (UPF0061 family)
MATSTESISDNNIAGWRFDNTYSRLPEALFAPAQPARVQAPRVSILNHALADELGLDLSVRCRRTPALFAGQDLPSGSQPIAQAYAGHQFCGSRCSVTAARFCWVNIACHPGGSSIFS